MNEDVKVAIVSTVQPETNYTRCLYKGLLGSGRKVRLWIDNCRENVGYAKKEEGGKITVFWKNNMSFPFLILRQARKEKVDVIHFQHEFNMYGRLLGLFIFPLAILLLKIFGKKIIVTIHAIPSIKEIDNDFLKMMKIKGSPWVVKIGFRIFFGLVWKFSNMIIVHSNYTRGVCEGEYGMKERTKVVTIGIEVRKNKKFRSHLILFFGYVLERKGLDELIVAFNDHLKVDPKAKLIIAGGVLGDYEDYMEHLKQLVKKLKIKDKVIFTGFLSQNKIVDLYQKANFLVFPYTRSISSSLPLSIALGFGKAVVVAKIGTLSEEIEDGISGLYCEPGQVESILRTMNRLVLEKGLREKLESGALEMAKRRSWKLVAERTFDIYQKVLRND